MVIDATVGAGGHARALLQAMASGGRLLGIDRDPAMLAAARRHLSGDEARVTLVRGSFEGLERIVAEHGFSQPTAILFDLGVSSLQLDDPARGLSFRQEGPLDMRLDPDTGVTAADLVNGLDEPELARLIRELGEERWAARIAQFIVQRRPLASTLDLARAVEAAIPRRAWPRSIHPATRTFQALRMTVNEELSHLESGLKAATQTLTPGGRMATISFHSLEDRMVKSHLNVESKDCLCPPNQPVCTCAHRASLRVLTRRPIKPSVGEIKANPRSRSARLRAAERI